MRSHSDEWFILMSAKVSRGSRETTTPRELLRLIGYERRGEAANDIARQRLHDVGLRTEPDFADCDFDETLQLESTLGQPYSDWFLGRVANGQAPTTITARQLMMSFGYERRVDAACDEVQAQLWKYNVVARPYFREASLDEELIIRVVGASNTRAFAKTPLMSSMMLSKFAESVQSPNVSEPREPRPRSNKLYQAFNRAKRAAASLLLNDSEANSKRLRQSAEIGTVDALTSNSPSADGEAPPAQMTRQADNSPIASALHVSAEQASLTQLDRILRYEAPFPVAASYKTYKSSADDAQSVQNAINLTENLVRFFALIGLADAMSRSPSERKKAKWLECLHEGSFGPLFVLAKSTTKFLQQQEKCFMPELTQLATGDFYAAADAIKNVRNRLGHPYRPPRGRTATLIVQEIEQPMATIIGKLSFLKDYALLVPVESKVTEDSISYRWYHYRGFDDNPPSLWTRATSGVNCFQPWMLNRAAQGLRIHPLLRWADVAATAGQERLLYCDRVKKDRRTLEYKDVTRPGVTGWGRTDDANRPLNEATAWRPVKDQLIPAREVEHLFSGPTFSLEPRYVTIGRLGAGGQGEVWDMQDTRINRRVAVKLLHPNLNHERSWRRRFEREARLLSRINHPAVVEVFDVCDFGGTTGIVMERVEAESLEEALLAGTVLDEAKVVNITLELLDALEAIHAAGVVHRDLKPSNLMLSTSGLRIVDFGIAGQLNSTRLTRNTTMGTFGYAAPEQLSGSPPPDPRMDVFAIGSILLRCLTGNEPHVHTCYELEKVLPGLRPAFRPIIKKAMAINACDRYADAQEMATALRAVQTAAEPEP